MKKRGGAPRCFPFFSSFVYSQDAFSSHEMTSQDSQKCYEFILEIIYATLNGKRHVYPFKDSVSFGAK